MHCNNVVVSDIFSNDRHNCPALAPSSFVDKWTQQMWYVQDGMTVNGPHMNFCLRAGLTSTFCTKFGDVLLKTVNQLTSICMSLERHLVATLFLPLQLYQIKSNWFTLTETIHFTYNQLISSVCLLWVSKYFHWIVKSASGTHWDFNLWSITFSTICNVLRNNRILFGLCWLNHVQIGRIYTGCKYTSKWCAEIENLFNR